MKKKLPIPHIGKRTLWKATFYGVSFLLISFIFTVLAVRYTERPQFCSTCHNMRPYIQAWKTSKHNKVPCVECHFEPGVLSTIQGKFIAINQLTKYITHTAGPRPSAEVSDKSCLRSGCHERRLIEGKVKFGKITFDHRPHMLSLRRGKKLRCTSCHSQIMIGSHMAVTVTTCFLCHFKNEPQGHAIGGCTGCHKLPTKDIVVQNMKFNHKEYIKEGASCDECHINVTSGNGNVSKERCVLCHNQPDRLARYSDSSFIHRKHVTEHKVECMQCHDQIEHGAVKMRSAITPQCGNCHGNLHTAQRDLFAGTGGRGVQGKPSPMFLAGVNCEGCHTVNRNSEMEHFIGTSLIVREIACMQCHGTGVSGILAQWSKYLDGRMPEFEKLLGQAAAKVARDGDSAEATRARKLLSDASYNYKLIHYGHGEHNITYSRALIDGSEEMLRSAINPKYVPKPMGQDETTVSCTQLCHINPPTKTLEFQGKTFPHGRHVNAKGLTCTDCHSAKVHKLTTITSKSCDNCHHEKFKQDCMRCHKPQLGGVTSYKGQKFPHADHIAKAKLPCDSCHIADKDNRMLFRQDCVTCHTKKKPASHTAQWRSQLHGKASMQSNAPCSNCHKPTFCSGCHQLDMPHAAGWSGKPHGDVAYKNRVLCRNCHQQDFCLNCHLKAKPSTGKHKECKGCHDPKTWKFLGATRSCDVCHKDHLSDKAPAKHKECIGCHVPHIWKPDAVPALCAKCHVNQAATNGKDVPDMVDCTICHNPHTWKFNGTDTCFGCHDDVAKDIGKSKIMPDCFTCHKKHQWKIKNISETCGACHQKVPDHDGDAFSNCTDCHKPHIWKP